MPCACLPSSILKWPDSLFHLKKRKVNGGGEEKVLLEAEQSFKGSRNQEVTDTPV